MAIPTRMMPRTYAFALGRREPRLCFTLDACMSHPGPPRLLSARTNGGPWCRTAPNRVKGVLVPACQIPKLLLRRRFRARPDGVHELDPPERLSEMERPFGLHKHRRLTAKNPHVRIRPLEND
jgi:hypothetical protein